MKKKIKEYYFEQKKNPKSTRKIMQFSHNNFQTLSQGFTDV